jgi:hypothetical protein
MSAIGVWKVVGPYIGSVLFKKYEFF